MSRPYARIGGRQRPRWYVFLRVDVDAANLASIGRLARVCSMAEVGGSWMVKYRGMRLPQTIRRNADRVVEPEDA